MDVLSDVLQNVRLSGSVMFRGEFRAPWSLLSPPSSDYASLLVPGASRLVIFHVVVEGKCVVTLLNGAPVQLAAGDAVMLAGGDGHVLCDGVGVEPVPLVELLPMPPWRKAPFLEYGGNGPTTQILCGFLHCADVRLSPFLEALPPVARIDGRDGVASSLAAVQKLLVDEARNEKPGYSCVLSRLTETFFVEALRRYMSGREGMEAFAALSDPVVGRALALIHGEPMRAWTVDALAREVAVSRSLLADRFTALMGCPPMRYVTRWRLLIAARRLAEGAAGIAAVAAEVGYESESAFSHAFKRHLGAPPASWLARQRRNGG